MISLSRRPSRDRSGVRMTENGSNWTPEEALLFHDSAEHPVGAPLQAADYGLPEEPASESTAAPNPSFPAPDYHWEGVNDFRSDSGDVIAGIPATTMSLTAADRLAAPPGPSSGPSPVVSTRAPEDIMTVEAVAAAYEITVKEVMSWVVEGCPHRLATHGRYEFEGHRIAEWLSASGIVTKPEARRHRLRNIVILCITLIISGYVFTIYADTTMLFFRGLIRPAGKSNLLDEAKTTGANEVSDEELLKRLNDDNPGIRLSTVLWLAERFEPTLGGLRDPDPRAGKGGIPPTPAQRRRIVELLLDKHPKVQESACISAGLVAADEASARPLITCLGSTKAPIRRAAARALGRLKKLSTGVMQKVSGALIDALRDPKAGVSCMSAIALATIDSERMGEALPVLCRSLGAEDVRDRIAVAETLGRLRVGAQSAVPALERALRDEAPPMRLAAIRALGRYRWKAGSAVRTLSQFLPDQNESIRLAAIASVGEIGKGAEEALPILVELAGRSDEKTGDAAMASLTKIASVSELALGMLIRQSVKGNEEGRLRATRALGKLGQDKPEIASRLVKPLLEVLESKIGPLQREATLSLGRLGGVAVPALIRRIDDARPLAREQAAEALTRASARLGATASVRALASAALLRHLTDTSKGVQDSVREALAAMGPSAIPGLRTMLEGAGLPERLAALEVLPGLGLAGKGLFPLVVTALKSNAPELSRKAAYVFELLGPKAASAAPALAHGLESTNPIIRQNCAGAIVYLGQAAVPYLALRLEHKSIAVRYQTIRVLVRMGKEAAAAASALSRRLSDRSADNRIWAMNALVAIGSDSVAALGPVLRSGSDEARRLAADTIGRIRPTRSVGAAILKKAMASDPRPEVRAAAKEALSRLKP